MDESIAAYLDLAAAKAKQLAIDYRAGKLWEGDLTRGAHETIQQLQKVADSERRG